MTPYLILLSHLIRIHLLKSNHEQIIPFLRHLLELPLSLLVNSLPEHFAPLHHFQLLKFSILLEKTPQIATPPTPETLVQITFRK